MSEEEVTAKGVAIISAGRPKLCFKVVYPFMATDPQFVTYCLNCLTLLAAQCEFCEVTSQNSQRAASSPIPHFIPALHMF
jgi:hypothetical protein